MGFYTMWCGNRPSGLHPSPPKELFMHSGLISVILSKNGLCSRHPLLKQRSRVVVRMSLVPLRVATSGGHQRWTPSSRWPAGLGWLQGLRGIVRPEWLLQQNSEKFREAMEKDFWVTSKKFRQLQKRKQSSAKSASLGWALLLSHLYSKKMDYKIWIISMWMRTCAHHFAN